MDLTTRYLGLELPHPFIVGAGPITDSVETAIRAVEGGAAAVVMRSLFEEQFSLECVARHHATEPHEGAFWEAMNYFPEPDEFALGPDEYLEHIGKLKGALSVPVIASLNGYTAGLRESQEYLNRHQAELMAGASQAVVSKILANEKAAAAMQTTMEQAAQAEAGKEATQSEFRPGGGLPSSVD